MSKLTHILPFLDDGDLKELAVKIINKEVKGIRLVMLFPFVSNSDLDEIVDMLIEKNMGKELTYVLPFASKETVAKISKGIREGTIKGVHESALYPFLGKEELKTMFEDLVKKAQEENSEEEDLDEEDLDDLDDEN